MQTEFNIDVKKMVPVRIVKAFVDEGKRRDEEWATESIEWSDIKGNIVAKQVSRDVKVGAKINGKPHVYTKTQRADIHCFSVNEELDDSLFDPENIRKLDRMLKMCDPEAAGATTLLEKKKEQSSEDKK